MRETHSRWTTAVRQENGTKGEIRTKAILLDHFWVLERSVDIGGGDFLVEMKYSSQEEYFKSRHLHKSFVYIQAKYFENDNEVIINKIYVIDSSGNPREDFFIFLHTDEEDDQITYFFSAREIVESFETGSRKGKDYFIFRKSKVNDSFKNRKTGEIKDIINKGLINTNYLRNKEILDVVNADSIISYLCGNERNSADFRWSTIDLLASLSNEDAELLKRLSNYTIKSRGSYFVPQLYKACGSIPTFPINWAVIFEYKVKSAKHLGSARFRIKDNTIQFTHEGTFHDLYVEDEDGKNHYYPVNEHNIENIDKIIDHSEFGSNGQMYHITLPDFRSAMKNLHSNEHEISDLNINEFFYKDLRQSDIRRLRYVGLLNADDLQITILPGNILKTDNKILKLNLYNPLKGSVNFTYVESDCFNVINNLKYHKSVYVPNSLPFPETILKMYYDKIIDKQLMLNVEELEKIKNNKFYKGPYQISKLLKDQRRIINKESNIAIPCLGFSEEAIEILSRMDNVGSDDLSFLNNFKGFAQMQGFIVIPDELC